MTHSKSEALRGTMTGSGGNSFCICTLLLTRRDIYSATRVSTSFMFDGTGSGSDPIFEKRSAMSCSRRTSFSISPNSESSGYCSFRISVHAISDEMGVPS